MFSPVFAHVEGVEEAAPSLTSQLPTLSLWGIAAAGVIALLFILLAILWRNTSERVKWFLYLGIALPILASTLFLAGSTVYLNLISVSGGPVHWHADFRVFGCGEELDLADPMGIENRIGSPVFHEHGDDRIHIEGVVLDYADVTLGEFFETVGGELHETHLSFPTNAGVFTYDNGDLCPDGKLGTLQVFAWKTDQAKKEFYQEKLEDPESYVVSPYGTIPPGDCLIIEFGEEKAQTEKLCPFYEIAEQKGDLNRR